MSREAVADYLLDDAFETAKKVIEENVKDVFMAIYCFPSDREECRNKLLEFTHDAAVKYQEKYEKMDAMEILKEKLENVIERYENENRCNS